MILIKNLSFGYRKKKMLFKNLELQLPAGNIYGLLGKNGAGKTSLLKIISGLRFPRSGDCEVLGYKPLGRWVEFLQQIYLIPEEYAVPSITIEKFNRLYSPFYPNFDNERFKNCLHEFDLSFDTNLPELSLGQQKKFLLAFGLATECGLFLLDEPTNGLDIPSKSQFRKMLASSINEDKTFIIATHHVRDVENLIDSIIIIDDGKIIFNQSLQAISYRLCFKLQTETPDKDVIYSEKTLGGYIVVMENKNGEQTKIQLEILFNTVTSHTEKINDIFRKEAKDEH